VDSGEETSLLGAERCVLLCDSNRVGAISTRVGAISNRVGAISNRVGAISKRPRLLGAEGCVLLLHYLLHFLAHVCRPLRRV